MNLRRNIFILLIIKNFFIAGIICAKKSYKGYKIYLLQAHDEKQREDILNLQENTNYDFIQFPAFIEKEAKLVVAPEYQKNFEHTLNKLNMQYSIINENLESHWEDISNKKVETINIKLKPTKRYMTFDEINKYLDDLATAYPDKINITVIGKSYEQRPIKLIKIPRKYKNKIHDRSTIMVEAGAYGREWISISSTLLFIYYLVVHSGNASSTLEYDWLIIPIVNPDGFLYSHTTDRLWLKTRRPTNQTDCFGVNINRNFGYLWGGDGSSNNPCHANYKGYNAFSEPESKALRDVILSYNKEIVVYLSLHSYGSSILYPWAHSSEIPRDIFHMNHLAKEGANAIHRFSGNIYKVGSAAWELYNFTGCTFDYAYAVARIPNCFVMFTRGNSIYPYQPPESKIKTITEEVWIGITTIIRYIYDDLDEMRYSHAIYHYPLYYIIALTLYTNSHF